MPAESALLQLVALIYDVAQDPSRWSELLERYADALGATMAFIQQHNFEQRTSALIATFGMHSRFTALYHEHFSCLNVWRNRGQHLYRTGRVLLDQEICSHETLARTEFYNDYLRPQDVAYSASGVIDRKRDTALSLTALRSPRQQPWSESERQTIQLLLPHVARAREIQTRLQLLSAGPAVLDNLDIGVAFVRAPADLVYANHVAEAMFEQADGLAVRNGVVCVCDSANDVRFRQAIREAVAATPTLVCPAAIAVERRALLRPYQLLVAPLVQAVPTFTGMPSPHAMVVIVDPDRRRAVPPDLLIRLYGLTPREAALASALSIGTTVEAAAGEDGITYETARSHLRRIFEKTGTSRQPELIVLLARIPVRAD